MKGFIGLTAKESFFSFLLAFLLFASPAWGASAQISWNANTEIDLAGYEVYFGTQSGIYGAPVVINDKTTTSYTLTIPNPAQGCTYFFALKAFDTSGNRSVFSTEVPAFLPDTNAPGAPKSVLILIRVE